MNGTIFNIQKFCVNDGPGIRTTVFLKGCPLKCTWCHNPESQTLSPELMFYTDKCILCGICEQVCDNLCHKISNGIHIFDRTDCAKCFKCIAADCGALEKVGEEKSSEEIICEVLKDKIFYDNSGGGITLSGGEPLCQFDFALDILKKSKENGLHTAIETCGFTASDKLCEIAEYVDLFLFDYKETNPELHKKFTGVDNKLIMDNLELLNKINKDVILRCPIIPSFNDRAEHFKGICDIANKFKNILHIELEPYHSLGEGKYISLGQNEHKFTAPDEAQKDIWLQTIRNGTSKTVKFA